MKPKFALDLSHEGINLLHRSKGGWSLVGSVALDDTEMGTHLAQIRRKAAELESGGFTCKIIIPNSQILYTTIEAPGPDDIAREVQIRSGLDGLTPYPVGELVFDWRAAGERARVAVLARDTMDEAENFAAEHKFNPVSFVARPPQGEFSGEPFFGKTRAATKILGPTERVEPDASPVPRRPRAIEPGPAPGPAQRSAPGPAPEPTAPPEPGAVATPHAAADLAWGPPAEPRAAQVPEDTPPPIEPPVPEPLDSPLPDVSAADDPFAELDAIQAELSGDPDAAPPAFRSRASRNRSRTPRPGAPSAQPAPPPLAPFPPTSDDPGAKPAPTAQSRKPRGAAKPDEKPTDGRVAKAGTAARAETPAPRTAGAEKTAPAGRGWTPPDSTRPAALDGPHADAALPEDDTPPAPGVAFSTRRHGNASTTTATPTARSAPGAPARSAAPTKPAQAPTQPPAHGARKEMSPSDRRRADMAAAMSRPLPGTPAKPETGSEPDDRTARASLTGAMRDAAGGLRALGQRRTVRKDEETPPESSMTELMRGAGSSEARISPDQDAEAEAQAKPDEPDLLAPGMAAAQDAATTSPTARKPAAEAGTAPPPSQAKPAPAPGKTVKDTPTPVAETTAKPATARAAQPPAAKPTAPAPAPIPAAKPARAPDRPKGSGSEAETLTVFGARQAQEKRGRRKYLGLILTLLLLLFMGVIALWSSFFVEDGDPALFNPTEETAPEPGPAAVPETPDAPTADTAPDDTAAVPETDAAPPPEDAVPEEGAPETAVPTDPEVPPTPQVLTPEEAETFYAESQIWQRAPETLAEPRTPGLDIGTVGGPGTGRAATADPAGEAEPDTPAAPRSALGRAAPLPPPPADTVFQLDENGLVSPSPDGTVSPTGIIVFDGPPEVVPPDRPGFLAPPEPEPGPEPDAAAPAPDEVAPDPAAAPLAPPIVPDIGPLPGPEDAAVPVLPETDATAPDATGPDDARLETAPTDEAEDGAPATETAAADLANPDNVETVAAATDAAAIDAAVDAVASSFVDPSELAVATSIKPTRRPANIDQIVEAAAARAAAAPAVAAPATTTPAIPTSASVAERATTPDAIDLREINLLGISGPSNALRALVRLPGGGLATVKVGDRLDGGRVTSITSDGLTYQKGSRSLTLQLLPLG